MPGTREPCQVAEGWRAGGAWLAAGGRIQTIYFNPSPPINTNGDTSTKPTAPIIAACHSALLVSCWGMR